MRHPRRLVVIGTAAALVVAALTGCNDDGRTLREPGPDQTASISSVADTSSDTALTFPDPDDPDTVDDDSLDPSTLPGERRVVVAPWRDGAPIDARNTCDGRNVSPALSWDAAPVGAQEIAVSMTDLDAPGFVHWVIAGLSPSTPGLEEGEVPLGAVEATNSVGDVGYTGPCPPAGSRHTYLVSVHYLAEPSGLTDGETGEEMFARIRATVLATAEVTGTFARG